MVKNLPANAGDAGSIPGWGRSPGEGNGNPLQYSYLGNPMDRGAWRLQSMGSQRVRHNQLQIAYIQPSKSVGSMLVDSTNNRSKIFEKNSIKFQKAKLEFIADQELHT